MSSVSRKPKQRLEFHKLALLLRQRAASRAVALDASPHARLDAPTLCDERSRPADHIWLTALNVIPNCQATSTQRAPIIAVNAMLTGRSFCSQGCRGSLAAFNPAPLQVKPYSLVKPGTNAHALALLHSNASAVRM